MAIPKPPTLSAAKPVLSDHFDAWNSSATGHQRAENRLGGSTGWRESRSMKLSHQFKTYTGGKALIPKDVGERARMSVRDMLVTKPILQKQKPPQHISKHPEIFNPEKSDSKPSELNRGIFDGLVIYINGSTYPAISDHKLKHLLAENGARMSIHLGRRQVTHVILGRPNGRENKSGFDTGRVPGAGGGLAATKIQKEIKRVGGCGVKYVGVEWVLESIKAGRRVPETPFSNLNVAAKSQKSVYNIFNKNEVV